MAKMLNFWQWFSWIFDNDLVAICKYKVRLMLNKPEYVGICILDLSKVFMYESHHGNNKNKYCNNSRPSFTDTDSFEYEIKTEDLSEDFSKDKEVFGFSNYSIKSKYYDDSNILIVLKLKGQTDDIAIEPFFGLKPKM